MIEEVAYYQDTDDLVMMQPLINRGSLKDLIHKVSQQWGETIKEFFVMYRQLLVLPGQQNIVSTGGQLWGLLVGCWKHWTIYTENQVRISMMALQNSQYASLLMIT